jgi:hypothetical protein
MVHVIDVAVFAVTAHELAPIVTVADDKVVPEMTSEPDPPTGPVAGEIDETVGAAT